MNKFYLFALALMVVGSPIPMRSEILKSQPQMKTASAAMSAPESVSLSTPVASIYDNIGETNANYYLLLSDDPTAGYDRMTANLKITTGYVLKLDLYNSKSDPVVLEPGVYRSASTNANFTYDPQFTCLAYYENGTLESEVEIGDVNVSCDGSGIYTITTNTTDGTDVTYTGKIPFVRGTDKPTVYDQIKEDLTVNLDKGGIAFYQGVTDYSNNGITYINLYNGTFNVNGGMTGPGMSLVMMVAHKRVVKKSAFRVFPGTYIGSTTLDRDTWYPCRELEFNIENQSITMPFGSYLQRRDESGNYSYAYLKTGTFVIEEGPDGTYKGTIDAVTDLGYTIKGTFSGSIALDTSNAIFQSGISNLEDDVECDFSKLKVARLYHSGEQGGCRTFKLDIGSPNGQDSEILYGGDLMRVEFLSPMGHIRLEPGVYTVVPIRWNSYELAAGGQYEPMSLNKGYFATGGVYDGTNYNHFEDGRYGVINLHAPAEEGSVRVETDDYQNYRITLDITDDSGFKITGVYDGPVQYTFNPDALSGIGQIEGDGDISVYIDGRSIVVLNAGEASVALYDLCGRKVASGTASAPVDVSDLAANIYVLKVMDKTFKIILK